MLTGDRLCSVHGRFSVRRAIGKSDNSLGKCSVLPLFSIERRWMDVEDEGKNRRDEREEIENQCDIPHWIRINVSTAQRES